MTPIFPSSESREPHRRDLNDVEWASAQPSGDPNYEIGDVIEFKVGGIGVISEVRKPQNGWPSQYATKEVHGIDYREDGKYAWHYEGDFAARIGISPVHDLKRADNWGTAKVTSVGEELVTVTLDNGETRLLNIEDYERAYGPIKIGQKLVRDGELLIPEGFKREDIKMTTEETKTMNEAPSNEHQEFPQACCEKNTVLWKSSCHAGTVCSVCNKVTVTSGPGVAPVVP